MNTLNVDCRKEVTTSLRIPNGWIVRAENLGPMLALVPEFAAAYGSNTSRSAVLRLALLRGLVGLEALVSDSEYGPWIEIAQDVWARHDQRGLWFVRVRVEPGGCTISSKVGGVVYNEGRTDDLGTAMTLADEVLQRRHAAGEYPSHLPLRPLKGQ